MDIQVEEGRINDLIEMIGAIASLNFSKRVETDITNDPIDVMAYGLNMLSEELEANVVKKSMLEETNQSLERFCFTVAHDIKSPLNSTHTLIALIEAELEGIKNDSLKQYIELLKLINEQTRDMVNGILDYSRTNFNNTHMEEIDLQSLCHQIAEEYTVNKRVNITYPTKLPVVYYNSVALKQIVANLINNAIKHNDKPVCAIELQCIDKDDYFEFSIADNGPGIPEESSEKIFNLFENLKNTKTDSYGIGLSIVKKLVTQANGHIWVHNNVPQGAKFVFTIAKSL